MSPAVDTKTSKKSDEILDDLFSKIKKDDVTDDSDESSSDEENDDSDSDERRRKHKKKKKKHKKEKKKKKKKSREKESDGFWGQTDPYSKKIKKEKETDSSRESKYDRIDRLNDRSHDKSDDKYDKHSSKHDKYDDRYDRDYGRSDRDDRDSRDYGKYDRDERDRRDYGKYDRDERDSRDFGRSDRDDRDGRDFGRSDRDDRSSRDLGRSDRDDRSSRDKNYREKYDRSETSSRSDRSRREPSKERKKGNYDRSKDERGKDDKRRDRGEEKKREKSEEVEAGGGDGFWDTKWDAMVLEDRIQKGEKRGRYYLNTNKRFKDATGVNKEGTPSLTPSPDRNKKDKSDSESDTEEYKRMKKNKEIQELKFEGDGLVEGTVPDPANYEYDKLTMMYRKKAGMVAVEANKGKKKEDKTGEDQSGSSEESGSGSDEEKDEDGKKKAEKVKVKIEKGADKEKVAEELMKEIEDLESELDKKDEIKKEEEKVAGEKIDWSASALSHLKDEEKVEKEKEDRKRKKKKKEKKSDESEQEEGEVELSSEEEDKKSPKRRKKSRSRSRGRGSYSRDGRQTYDRQSREAWGLESSRSSRHRSRSRDGYDSRTSRGRDSHDDRSSRSRRSRSPYDRVKRERYDRKRSRSRSRSRDRVRRRERRSRSRSRDGSWERERDELYERNKRRQEKHLRSKINKERLLEIAKKNAAKILKTGGDFMGIDEDRLIAMKAGGQSLDELTRFCKELAKKGLEDKEKIDFLAESESESDEEFRHPFMVKDKPLPNPITMLLGAGGAPAKEELPPAARAVAKSQRMLEYPVSSGNAHRQKIDVTGEEPLAIDAQERLAIEMKQDEEEMLRFHEQLEAEEKAAKIGIDPEIKPWKLNDEDQDITTPNPMGKDMFNGGIKELPAEKLAEIEKLKPKPVSFTPADSTPAAPLALPAPTDPIAPEPKLSAHPDKVFEVTEAPVVDIGTIVSKRLNAQRKLQQNPEDASALQDMYDAQKQMEQWATSKNKPGQFVGATGANILKKHELNNGQQAWARKEQFENAKRVRGGFGEFMLKKMGWEEGDGLGKNKHGDTDPLQLDIKFDKKGLTAAEELEKDARGVVTLTGCKDLAGKHPVSALTELCSKRRWGPPLFNEAFAVGPPHKKQFVFKVTVNGRDYMANVAIDNKKKAKANAALVCLQTMGLVAKDPDNPV